MSIDQLNDWMFNNVVPLANPVYVQHRDSPEFPNHLKFRFREKPLLASDWTPNQLDVVKWVPVIESSFPFFNDSKRQDIVLLKLRSELLDRSSN